MNIQIQKEEIEGAAVEARRIRFGVRALADVIRMEVRRRREVARMVGALADAVAMITAREGREAARLADLRTARRQAKLDRVRLRTLNDGQTVAAPNKKQAAGLKEADALEAGARAVLAQEDPKASPSARRAAHAALGKAYGLRHKVEAERAAALVKRQNDMRVSEAVTLDGLRSDGAPGSLIERRRGQSDPRLRERDGLKLLHERGAFRPKADDGGQRKDQSARIESDRLLSIGLRYRDRYEMAAASLKSCLAESERVKTSRNIFVEAKMAHRAAALNRRVREWEGMVSMKVGPDGLEALRLVAGEARTIVSITSSSRRRERLSVALRDALELLGDRVARDA